jgi:hypothetical protein
MFIRLLWRFVVAILLIPLAHAGSVVTTPAGLGATDCVDWGQFGAADALEASGFTAISNLSLRSPRQPAPVDR